MIWQGPRKLEDITPIRYPNRHLPMRVVFPYAASDQPARVMVPLGSSRFREDAYFI